MKVAKLKKPKYVTKSPVRSLETMFACDSDEVRKAIKQAYEQGIADQRSRERYKDHDMGR